MLEGRPLGPRGGVHRRDGRKPKIQRAWFVLGTFPGPALYARKEKDVFLPPPPSFIFPSLFLDRVTSVAKSQNRADYISCTAEAHLVQCALAS